ncbi:MAG: isochorismatase family cysteine hydrolase [Rhodoferax sp.]|uniref:cysteine hydrolase family protein n=1 Tax=Rhodoferax sp. TaxID=50421 RepID=UPI0032653D5B
MSLTITALPFDYPLDVARAALVIIDMQRDFIEPGGFGATLGNNVALLEAIVPASQAMLAAWRTAGGLVVHTREAHKADLSDCPPAKLNRGNPALRIGDLGAMGRILVAGEPGNQIIPALAPVDGEIVINKPGKGAFYATGLHEMLQQRGIQQLLFMGVTTEVCVQTSMREANDRGYDGLLLEDCTESYFPAFKAATLEMVRAQGGIVGWTAPSAAVLQALATV